MKVAIGRAIRDQGMDLEIEAETELEAIALAAFMKQEDWSSRLVASTPVDLPQA